MNIPEATMKEVLLETIDNTRKELPFSLTVKDLKKLLPFSDTRIYQMLECGDIPGRKINGKWVIPRDSFLAWFYGNDEIQKEIKLHA